MPIDIVLDLLLKQPGVARVADSVSFGILLLPLLPRGPSAVRHARTRAFPVLTLGCCDN